MKSNIVFGCFDQWRENYFASIIGVPFEKFSSYRPGTSLAPNAIRLASENIETYSLDNDIDIEELGIKDLGNIYGLNMDEYFNKIKQPIKKTLELNQIPVLLGGEHTITLSILDSFSSSLFVVIDAHSDLRDEWMGSKYSHACVFRRFLEKFSSEQLFQIGTRAVSKAEVQFAKRTGIKQIKPNQFHPKKIANIINDISSSFKSIYISIDVDGFDPSFAPGVGTPEANGLTPREFFEFVKNINSPIAGFDVVEVNPAIDPSNITSILAARIIFEVLAHEAKRQNFLGV